MSNLSSLRNDRTLIVQGRVLRGDEQIKKYCRERGLCFICGEIQTHKKVGPLYNRSWEPLTITDDKGNITVYKGHCIQATCYTSVDQVKELLGEKLPKKKAPGYRPGSSSSGSTITPRSQRRPFQPDNVYKPPLPQAPIVSSSSVNVNETGGDELGNSGSGQLDVSGLSSSLTGLTLEDDPNTRRHSSSLEGSNSSFSRSNAYHVAE